MLMKKIQRVEKLYKEFLSFRERFLKEAMELATVTQTAILTGEAYRPIVIVPPEKFLQFESDIELWAKYAFNLEQLATDVKQFGAAKRLFYPFPKLITNASNVTYYTNEASAQQTRTVKAALRQLTVAVRSARTHQPPEQLEQVLDGLNKDREILSSLPPETVLICRRTGYNDLYCSYETPDASGRVVTRVSSNGAFFDGREVTEIKLAEKAQTNKTSFYDQLTPLPIKMYGGCKVYLEHEAKALKEHLKGTKQERRIQSRVKRAAKQAAERAAARRAREEAEAAAPTPPVNDIE
ncbi:hypothetical protein C1N62_21815 (plasmid) [Nissabacter sp. SGAir0207]|nr:hypothetical protein C1N62_21815 [Nissabacter sp. SGAir0207]